MIKWKPTQRISSAENEKSKERKPWNHLEIKQDKRKANQNKVKVKYYEIYIGGPFDFAKIKGSCWGGTRTYGCEQNSFNTWVEEVLKEFCIV